ncbi:GIY-YIG nuclease family protein, partial [Lacticaseibacillus rhamnosus]
MESKYYVYMLLCSDKTFYTGTSNDVKKRVKTH